MSRIRVLIADDHAVVREGLVRMVEDQPDMRVVAEAADGEAAIRACTEHDPHIALLDMRMPGLGGVAAIRRLRERCPATRVLVLSMYEDPYYVRAALAAGAHAYLGKRSSSLTLLAAIRALRHKGTLFAADGDARAELGPRLSPRGLGALSAREQEVMQMIVQGHTSREIGSLLGLSKSSIDTYRARLFRKFGVESRAELIARLADESPAPSDEDSTEPGRRT
jgi:DNA-binding NarL/FixJ family response regulator